MDWGFIFLIHVMNKTLDIEQITELTRLFCCNIPQLLKERNSAIKNIDQISYLYSELIDQGLRKKLWEALCDDYLKPGIIELLPSNTYHLSRKFTCRISYENNLPSPSILISFRNKFRWIITFELINIVKGEENKIVEIEPVLAYKLKDLSRFYESTSWTIFNEKSILNIVNFLLSDSNTKLTYGTKKVSHSILSR